MNDKFVSSPIRSLQMREGLGIPKSRLFLDPFLILVGYYSWDFSTLHRSPRRSVLYLVPGHYRRSPKGNFSAECAAMHSQLSPLYLRGLQPANKLQRNSCSGNKSCRCTLFHPSGGDQEGYLG